MKIIEVNKNYNITTYTVELNPHCESLNIAIEEFIGTFNMSEFFLAKDTIDKLSGIESKSYEGICHRYDFVYNTNTNVLTITDTNTNYKIHEYVNNYLPGEYIPDYINTYYKINDIDSFMDRYINRFDYFYGDNKITSISFTKYRKVIFENFYGNKVMFLISKDKRQIFVGTNF